MKIGGIFVRTDDPVYLEHQVIPDQEIFSLEKADVTEMRAAYRAKQANFCTAPFDPEGRVLRFFPGGFTIWSGYPGHGKTTLLRQMACHLMSRGRGVFVCSLEEDPEDVLMRHAEVALGNTDPSDIGLQWCLSQWQPKLKLWSYRPGSSADAKHQRIFAAIRVMARDFGIRHAILDSLMCLDVPATDWEAQRLFTQALAATCQLSGVHVHLVAHPRKPSTANQDMDIGDVAGSSDLGRKADNVLFVKRAANEEQSPNPDCRPMRVSIKKQRYGTGHVTDIAGNFNVKLRQFVLDMYQERPTNYLPELAYHDDMEARA